MVDVTTDDSQTTRKNYLPSLRQITYHVTSHITRHATRQVTGHLTRQITRYVTRWRTTCQITDQKTRHLTRQITRQIILIWPFEGYFYYRQCSIRKIIHSEGRQAKFLCLKVYVRFYLSVYLSIYLSRSYCGKNCQRRNTPLFPWQLTLFQSPPT